MRRADGSRWKRIPPYHGPRAGCCEREDIYYVEIVKLLRVKFPQSFIEYRNNARDSGSLDIVVFSYRPNVHVDQQHLAL